MKGLFLTAALGVLCIPAFAQGTVNFSNQGVDFEAPVYDAHGLACRNTFFADLFWAPGVISDSSLLTPLNAPALFSFSAPGYFYGGTRTLPTLPNLPVTVQVRVWDVYSGPSWYAASTVWGAMIGESIMFQVSPADPSGTPAPLTGLSNQPQPWQLFYNIPEPSTLVFAVLGIPVIWVLRRPTCARHTGLNYPVATNLATTFCCHAESQWREVASRDCWAMAHAKSLLCLLTAGLCMPIGSAAQINTNVAVHSGVGTNSPFGIGALQEVRANVHDLIDSTVASHLLASNAAVRRALLDAKGAQDLGWLGPRDTEAIWSLLGKLDGFQPTPNAAQAMRYPRFIIATVPGYVDAPNSFKRKVYVNAYLVRVPTRGWFFLETRRTLEPVQ